MDTAYWQLFWTTGLPEAWLMSRGGQSAAPAQQQAARRQQGEVRPLRWPEAAGVGTAPAGQPEAECRLRRGQQKDGGSQHDARHRLPGQPGLRIKAVFQLRPAQGQEQQSLHPKAQALQI